MNALNVAEYTHSLGLQAKTASALMAKAPAAIKNKALKALARLLRESVAQLQIDNAKDLERAVANGLAGPMVDRLKLTPKVLETCAEGCEQLAAMVSETDGRGIHHSMMGMGRLRVRSAASMGPPSRRSRRTGSGRRLATFADEGT